jgi:hypothetical protein
LWLPILCFFRYCIAPKSALFSSSPQRAGSAQIFDNQL